MDKEINEYKSVAENLENLNRPVTAFVSFVREEGIVRACELSEQGDDPTSPYHIQFLGEKLEFIQSNEPTDIIWENRHFTMAERIFKSTQVAGVIAFLLLCSFMVIYNIKQGAVASSKKYSAANCEILH